MMGFNDLILFLDNHTGVADCEFLYMILSLDLLNNTDILNIFFQLSTHLNTLDS